MLRSPLGTLARSTTAFVLALAVAVVVSHGLAHAWQELDRSASAADVEAVVAAAERLQTAWLAADPAPVAPSPLPAELAWWRWFEARLAAAPAAEVEDALRAVAPAWFDEAAPRDVVAWWSTALGDLAAHAAARTVGPDARAAAATALTAPDPEAEAALVASWIVVLPTLSDAERAELAPVFARLDALVAAVVP